MTFTFFCAAVLLVIFSIDPKGTVRYLLGVLLVLGVGAGLLTIGLHYGAERAILAAVGLWVIAVGVEKLRT